MKYNPNNPKCCVFGQIFLICRGSMPRLPDRFDLWVRKAQEMADPARQVDLVLGALVARDELYFLNVGTKEQPQIFRADIDSEGCALVFTDATRVEDFLGERPEMKRGPRNEIPVIATPMASALAWCVENSTGLMINPEAGETVVVPPGALAAFVAEWKQRGERQAAGFWIPSMTTEEEDFWQEHGL
jgi:hypothetical protein